MRGRSLSFRMLLGRLLTRSGDQAWDFAIPLVLLQIFPGDFRLASIYFLLVRVAMVLFLPRISQIIDQVDRQKAAQFGIFLQLIGVIAGLASVIVISKLSHNSFQSITFVTVFVIMILSGIASQLGSTFMDISIANDLVPSSFKGDQLASFNSRLRQVDLFTEVVSPVIAGALLLINSKSLPLLGFSIIALWNIMSFLPEYEILKSIFKDRPDLKSKLLKIDESSKQSILTRLRRGWSAFFKEPIAPAILAYALLWFSVLSPHGVLLTAFLMDGWKLPEVIIGVFRGLGAVFGLLATVLFPIALKNMSVKKASLAFLSFQATVLIVGFCLFLRGDQFGQFGFLTLILFSRIGLYGFSLGEMQIRQTSIDPSARGEVNGFANALTSLATIGLFSAGVAMPSTDDFKYLVLSSVAFVVLALTVYWCWYRKTKLH